jgi:hypothetical protein
VEILFDLCLKTPSLPLTRTSGHHLFWWEITTVPTLRE